MNDAWVTAIVPAYQAAGTLAATLASLSAQSRPDWRAVIVNDGSTDATPAIARAFARADGRIAVIDQPNRGVSEARNAGIRASSTPWIHCLDADDRIDPSFYERTGAVLGRANAGSSGAAGGICTGYRIVDAQERVTHTRPGPTAARLEAAALLERGNVGPPACFMLDRRAVPRVGGFATALSPCEDWDLLLRLICAGLRLATVPDVLVTYRSGAPSASRDYLRFLDAAGRLTDRVLQGDPRYAAPGLAPAETAAAARRCLARFWRINLCRAIEQRDAAALPRLFAWARGRLDPDVWNDPETRGVAMIFGWVEAGPDACTAVGRHLRTVARRVDFWQTVARFWPCRLPAAVVTPRLTQLARDVRVRPGMRDIGSGLASAGRLTLAARRLLGGRGACRVWRETLRSRHAP